ncbi:MAG TPA: helix-turn-helix domain-containing protein [Shinella sp.]|jgi:excisionase family DNA binding protein|uniref:helix-turn-helix domain-containing protein n=1 Tax=unclassified Shinella TaxID=2643062 RepID=UPI002415395B|nr:MULTISPECIES: helix-turn-helix domain-containing protein [unclassified Shinella]MDG4675674.1 helix-turn-helix domain-containing protein [Shinella sp. 838]HEV7246567.1 helix-turn-helix domain-containing protein [Shinella sp.]
MTKMAVGVSEAAKMIGLGRTSIYVLFNEKKLTPRKSGKRTLILVKDLEEYLNSLPVAA